MSDILISELAVPRFLDAQDARDFIALVQLANRISEDSIGTPDFSFTAEETLPVWGRPGQKIVGLTAKRYGHLIGFAEYVALDDAPEAFVTVAIAPEHRRQGFGTELFTRVRELARDGGRTILQTHVSGQLAQVGPKLESPTGYGWVPADDAGPAFARAHGFTLEQVGSYNRLALPIRSLVQPDVGPDYEVLSWAGPNAPAIRADVAILLSRMSTDVPSAGLEVTEDVWDAERVRDMDERFESSPRIRLNAAARHVATGRLVALTTMDVPAESDRSVNQWGTIVLAEHRGHRLGMAVKLANLALLQRDYPGHPSVTTVNASENEHMLAVNEALGFVSVAYEASFQRALERTR